MELKRKKICVCEYYITHAFFIKSLSFLAIYKLALIALSNYQLNTFYFYIITNY